MCPRSSIGRQVLAVRLPLLDLARSTLYIIIFIFNKMPLQHKNIIIIFIIIIIIIIITLKVFGSVKLLTSKPR